MRRMGMPLGSNLQIFSVGQSMSVQLTEQNVSQDIPQGHWQTPRLLVASINISYTQNI